MGDLGRLSPSPVDSETQLSEIDAEWLSMVGAVREPLARFEAHQLQLSLDPSGTPLAAWTNRPDDIWQTAEGQQREDGSKPSTTLYVLYGPGGVLDAGPLGTNPEVAVGILDSWGEVTPDTEQATSAALGFNAPGNRAPQAILLAVPPDEDRAMDTGTLVGILEETREVARARSVTPKEVAEYGLLSRSAYLPTAKSGPTVVNLK